MALEELLITSSERATEWGVTLSALQKEFNGCFGSTEGWVCPTLKIIEESGVEINLQKCLAINEAN